MVIKSYALSVRFIVRFKRTIYRTTFGYILTCANWSMKVKINRNEETWKEIFQKWTEMTIYQKTNIISIVGSPGRPPPQDWPKMVSNGLLGAHLQQFFRRVSGSDFHPMSLSHKTRIISILDLREGPPPRIDQKWSQMASWGPVCNSFSTGTFWRV